MNSDSLPTVSVLIPCLNESPYIGNLLKNLIFGDYPIDKLKVYVLDGMSSDGTREIVRKLAKSNSFIHLVDNPGGSKPKALNLGIKMSESEIIVRLDAHAIYPSDYVLKLVQGLVSLNADNIGGVRRNLPRSNGVVAKTFSRVLTNKFGVGDAKHMTGVKGHYESDIVTLFCVRRKLFDEVGLFDERLLRGQDREFNLRLNRLKKKIYTIPEVECIYYSRDQFGSFIPWALECGATPLRITQLTGINLISLRNLIPVAFVCWIIIFGILALISNIALTLFLLCLAAYLTLALIFSVLEWIEGGKIYLLITLPLAFFLWHTAYGLGFLRQSIFWNKEVRA